MNKEFFIFAYFLKPIRFYGIGVNTVMTIKTQAEINIGKTEREFYDPPEVSTLLARIIAPKSGDEIADSCCFSGSLLIRTAQEVKDKNVALYGQEMNAGTWTLCLMNMFLQGIRIFVKE